MGMQKGKAKQFHLGDILSVTHDRLVSPEHITGVYKIMEHLFQQPVFTHQLVILHGEAKRELFRQHPWLESPTVAHCYNLLDSDIKAHGPERGVALLLKRAEKTAKELTGAKRPYFDVQPIANAEQRDPLSDLEGMVGKDKIVKVEI